VFELGIRPDGTAVEVFVNEERVYGPVNRIPDVTPVPWAVTGVAEPEASRVSG
jgi:hypothetical protein